MKKTISVVASLIVALGISFTIASQGDDKNSVVIDNKPTISEEQLELLDELGYSPPQTKEEIGYEELRKRLREFREEKERIAREEEQRKLEELERQRLERETELANKHQVLDTLTMEFTFYTADCKGCLGITRWGGYDVRNTIHYEGLRIIATDPTVIPAYSLVEFTLEGERIEAIALDIGGDIKQNRIDLLVSSYNEAITLGRQIIEVDVIRYGK